MKNIANDWKAFWTRWKSTEGPLSESGYEPEYEADNGSRNKEVSRVVAANPRHAEKTSDSSRIPRNWSGLSQRSNLDHIYSNSVGIQDASTKLERSPVHS